MIAFEVQGVPATKGSARAVTDKRTGRAFGRRVRLQRAGPGVDCVLRDVSRQLVHHVEEAVVPRDHEMAGAGPGTRIDPAALAAARRTIAPQFAGQPAGAAGCEATCALKI